MALNVKQEAFCLHYAKTGNATESYKKAGYEAKTDTAIYSNANRLLKNDKVRARLKELAEELASDKIANIKEIQEVLTAIMRGTRKEETLMAQVDSDGSSNIRKIMKEPALKDVISAAEKLAKMQGGFDSKAHIDVIIPIFGGEDDIEE